MKITVITPCWNEIRFVSAWLANCQQFADQVIVGDGGSTDGTLTVLGEMDKAIPGWLKIVPQQQPDDPQRYGFNEGARRKELTEMVKDGYVVLLDMDEFLPDDFRKLVTTAPLGNNAGSMIWLNLWRSPSYIRVGVPEDEHWGPVEKTVIFPAGTLHWNVHPHHSDFTLDVPIMRLLGVKWHLHYLYAGRKPYENRVLELIGRLTPEIRLKRITKAIYPKALGLLSEAINFGELAALENPE